MAKKKTKSAEASSNGQPQRKPRQRQLPGTEPDKIPEVEEAAEDFVAARDTRMANGVIEGQRKETLMNLMKKHKLKYHEYDNKRIEMIAATKETVKVKNKKDADDPDDDEKED